jgi:CheY-like chemotaxis protein
MPQQALWTRQQRGPGQRWPGRILLIGSDSVVSRTLRAFLRKEGYDAWLVAEDLDTWLAETGDAVNGSATPREQGRVLAPGGDVQLVIIAPSVSGARRVALFRRLRTDPRSEHVPILALHDAGDPMVFPVVVAPGGAAGGALESYEIGAGTAPDQVVAVVPEEDEAIKFDEADASLSWPFRLREVLGVVDRLLAIHVSRTAPTQGM